jgi:hypothetical protein
VTRERVERALDALAGIIASRNAEDAATLAPLYDRLERELAAFDRGADVQARARARLARRSRRQADPPIP